MQRMGAFIWRIRASYRSKAGVSISGDFANITPGTLGTPRLVSAILRRSPIILSGQQSFEFQPRFRTAALSQAVKATSSQFNRTEVHIGESVWEAQAVNAIVLAGRLCHPVQCRRVTNSTVANFSIAVSNGRNKPPMWTDVEVWGQLALAAAELQMGVQIHVFGKLVERRSYGDVESQGLFVRARVLKRIVNSYDSEDASSESSQPQPDN